MIKTTPEWRRWNGMNQEIFNSTIFEEDCCEAFNLIICLVTYAFYSFWIVSSWIDDGTLKWTNWTSNRTRDQNIENPKKLSLCLQWKAAVVNIHI